MIEQFVLYLQSRSKGEGASDYYQHFKKVIKYLYDNDIIRKIHVQESSVKSIKQF